MKLAILDDYLNCARRLADWGPVAARAEITVFEEAFASPAATAQALRDFDVLCLMRDRTPLSAETLAELPRLRLITITGRGNATLDYAAAAAAGITISYTERSMVEPTSELVWALIMATVRHVPANDAALRAGQWQARIGTTLSGRTLGVIGVGKIGSRVARYAQAFGMDVVAWSPSLTDDVAATFGTRRVAFDDLFRLSDVVTVHVPLKPETRGLIGAREIALMRPDAYLVNTSRGPVVDETALVRALHDGTIAGAGLDVYDREPLPASDPIVAAPNTVLLPHLGFVTRENMRVFYEDTVRNVLAWLDGGPIRVV